MSAKHKALVAAFNAAKEAAERARLANAEDGGTCNLDSPAIRAKGLRASTLEKAAKEAGLFVTSFTWFGSRAFFIGNVTVGMANLRCRMAEAAARAFNEHAPEGVTCTVFYAID